MKRELTIAVAGAAILASGLSGCSSNKPAAQQWSEHPRVWAVERRSLSMGRIRTCRLGRLRHGERQLSTSRSAARPPASAPCLPTPTRPW